MHSPWCWCTPASPTAGCGPPHIGDWLDGTAPAAVTVLSACAGDGRDLVDVLVDRLDAARVTATLVESDPRNAAAARERIDRLGIASVEVRQADAGVSDAYVGAVPADLVLLCGIFGNVSDDDVARTIAFVPRLCRSGARVVWTRHRKAPDLTPRIRSRFGQHAPEDDVWSVGLHRFAGEPRPLRSGQRLFTFVR